MAQKSKIFIFSDIDDTLIQTTRKTNMDKKSRIWAVGVDKKPISHMYENIEKLLRTTMKSKEISIIPTTARTLESYQRTLFYSDKTLKDNIEFIILNFGGVVVINNQIDTEWKNIIDDNYKNLKLPIDKVFDDINSILSQKFVKYNLKIRLLEGFYVDILNKHHRDNIELSTQINQIIENYINDEYYIYKNGSSFAILPNFLNKKYAVEYLIAKEKPILTIGAGDNKNDLDFMFSTDFLLVPNGSYNAKVLSKVV
ncbi:orf; Unknown function [hydrothermal vent metagenome]|uniref:Sucrose phosphatase-like domain-containing protein n=1 Tax=hydrothermal vent metagenome TaxID=652676 RepID=A0A1W1ELB1_9ZZZZ